MNDRSSLPPLFGANVDPSAGDLLEPVRRAQIADQSGLDLITIQDHPYNREFLDTWTLLTALAMKTERIHLGTNVISTPLRPPLPPIPPGHLHLLAGSGRRGRADPGIRR